jgi:hypothetical protein
LPRPLPPTPKTLAPLSRLKAKKASGPFVRLPPVTNTPTTFFSIPALSHDTAHHFRPAAARKRVRLHYSSDAIRARHAYPSNGP